MAPVGPGSFGPPMFIPHLVEGVPCSERLTVARGCLVKTKVFSDFHERPLELQPRWYDLYVCLCL